MFLASPGTSQQFFINGVWGLVPSLVQGKAPGLPLPMTRTAILISGRGSNMTSLLRAAARPGYPAEIVAVISNRPAAPGLDLARAAGIEALAIDHKPFGKDPRRP